MHTTLARHGWMAALLLALFALPPAVAQEPGELPKLGAGADGITVSGLSSGAFMAVQFQVAHSASVRGAGIVAGGPYYCSGGFLGIAATVCSCTMEPRSMCRPALADTAASLAASIQASRFAQSTGTIDTLDHLRGHRVWLFSGEADETVPTPVVDGLASYYATVGIPPAGIKTVTRLPKHAGLRERAGHGMPTRSDGVTCSASETPYINRCHYDAAGALLRWLYARPAPAPRGHAVPASLIEFDQRPFANQRPAADLAERGLVYVPAACRRAACRLHVVFHGCRQGQDYPVGPNGERYGRRFAEQAGYNEWAESNRIVVLYPQLAAPLEFGEGNPRGCWDFWGYSGAHFATRDGAQISVVQAMVDRLRER